MEDSELLRRYAIDHDEGAFAELVHLYVDLVHSVASRHLGSQVRLADDVTQSVFLLLAQKAHSLQSHPTLAGWIHRVTLHLAAKAQRSERRMKQREQEAAFMTNLSDGDDNIDQIIPFLDKAVSSLAENDRLAILIRFYLKKPMREVGLALGISEAAAKMRVGRALEHLRQFFAKQGLHCSIGVITLILAEKSIIAAPTALRSAILNKGFTHSTLSPASTLTRLTLFMTKTKLKIALLSLMFLIGWVSLHEYRSARESKLNFSSRPVKKMVALEPKKEARSPIKLFPAQIIDASDPRVKRLRMALSTHLAKNGNVWPDSEVIDSVSAFSDPKSAFAVLREAITNPETLITEKLGVDSSEDLVRERAMHAMIPLASRVPEVSPFLWETFRTDNFMSKVNAFSALEQIGFKPENTMELIQSLPHFMNSPAMQMGVPRAIAHLISDSPDATASSIIALQNMLASTDEGLQVSSASALVSHNFTDGRVSEVLSNGLASNNRILNRVAVEALGRANGQSTAFAGQLLELAKDVQDEYYKKQLLNAAAHLQPTLSESNPEISELIERQNQAKSIGIKVASGKAPIEELISALQLPQYAYNAALQLGELGPAASAAIPSLLRSLDGRSEEDRDRICDAIHKINPRQEIPRVDEKTITAALFETRVALGEREDEVYNIVMRHAAQSTWWTRDEAIAFAKELAAKDPRIQEVFINKAIQGDPKLREYFPGSNQ